MSHSKRNTSRPVFTAHERAIAKAAWASSSAKLSRESFLPFASCSLCLEPCRDPVACTHGDIFCRECALSNILAQKKEIKRLEKAREQEAREIAEEQNRMEAQAKERAIREFELTQQGLDVKETIGKGTLSKEMLWKKKVSEERGTKNERRLGAEETTLVAAKRGEKRKFELDDEELLRIAQEDTAKARKALDDEKAAKPKLPSFWVPTITPASNTKDILHEVTKKLKSLPTCPASPENKPHTYSLHTLISVHFIEEDTIGSDGKKQRICPACRKALTNASRAVMAKPCGHVLCKSCVTKFMIPSSKLDPHNPAADMNVVRCYVCDEDVCERKEKKGKEHHKRKGKIQPGLVDLRTEGTGFSAGGANTIQRSGVAFQC